MNGSIATFETLIPSLAARGLHVLVYDLYGFGLSQKPRGSKLNSETFTKQLLELLNALGVSSPVQIFAHSMGGIIATEFARRYPNRVQRLVLTAPAGLLKRAATPCRPFLFGCLRRAWGCAIIALVPLVALCCGCVVRKKIRQTGIAPEVEEPEKFEAYTHMATERFVQRLSTSLVSYFSVLRHMPMWEEDFRSSFEELAAGTIPLLFLWGDCDHTVPWDEVRSEVVDIFSARGASCIMVEGGGHGMNLEKSELVATLASSWCLDVQDPAWINCLNSWKLAGPQHSPRLGAPICANV
jgi:pimeloyl-ACP methyl ester carboxylesterase